MGCYKTYWCNLATVACNSLYPISGKKLLVYSLMKTLQTLRYLFSSFSSYPVWIIASQKNSPLHSVRASTLMITISLGRR